MSGAGEGLFAARDLPAGTIAAFYNGVRLPYVLGGPKEEWATSGYKIYVNADYKSGERMNIPVTFCSNISGTFLNILVTFGNIAVMLLNILVTFLNILVTFLNILVTFSNILVTFSNI